MPSYKLSRILKSPIPFAYLPYILLVLGLLGLLDATYLTIVHYKNVIPPCTLSGCETVLGSKYAELIPGIPTSLIGAGFYAVVMILSGLFIQTKAKILSSSLFALCSTGLAVGLVLVGIQAFVLHAFCQYCLLSELIDFLLFDAAWWLYSSE